MPRLLFPQLTFLILLVLFAMGINAQTCPGSPGCLDTTFGTSGMALVQSQHNVNPISSAVQSDGKIVAMPRGLISDNGHHLVRVNPDGTLDTTFGNNGTASFIWKLIKGNFTYYGNSNAIAIQNIGGIERILVVGQAPMLSGNKVLTSRLRVDRLMPDGSLDPTWGTNGSVVLNVSSAIAVAVQPVDQKIVVVSANYGEMIRLNANGTLDSTFGNGGVVSSGDGRNLITDSAGRILVAGLVTVGKGNNASTRISVKRFLTNGSIDTSFASGGTATTAFAINYRYLNVVIDSFGNVVIGSNSTTTDVDFAVARFTPGGLPDSSFSGDGQAFVDFGGNDIGQAAAVQSDGRIVIVGSADDDTNPSRLAIARLNYDGSVDNSFGTNGRATFLAEPGGQAFTTPLILVDPTCACEKILAVGSSNNYLIFGRLITF